MIIILEGFDEAGKSTLAAKLGEKLGWPTIHPGKRPKNVEEAYKMCDNQVGLFSFSNQLNLIMDRVSCISAGCYQFGTNAFSTYYKKLAMDDNILLVRCISYPENIVQKETDDEQSVQHAIDNQESIIKSYIELFQQFDHVIYDYKDKDSFYKLMKRIGFENIITKSVS